MLFIRIAFYKFVIVQIKDPYSKNELPNIMGALFLFFRYEFNDIVWCASDDLAQFLKCKHIDVLQKVNKV